MKAFQSPKYWEYSGIKNELHIKATLSSGKGGQNVNKVSTKAELYWHVDKSEYLSDDQKEIVKRVLKNKISQEGFLRITNDATRSFFNNSHLLVLKFYLLLSSCFQQKKERIKSKPTKTSIDKRLNEKSKHKLNKQLRQKPNLD
jgi:ribosome-associated protein